MRYEKVAKEDNQLTVKLVLQPEDYVQEYKTEIKKIQQKGDFKGFRKGKVPESFVTRMYGKATLAEVVSKKIDKHFSEIIAKEDINYIAQPLPSEGSELAFEPKNLNKEYEYSLDLGLITDIHVGGVGQEDVYTMYDVAVPQEEVDKQIQLIAETFGEEKPVDDTIQEKDVLKVSATELDGVAPKKDGWMASFDIVMQSVSSEDVKKELLTKKKGDQFVAKLTDITYRQAEDIRSQLLGVDADDDREIGEVFSFVIEEVLRTVPAEVTDELIKEKLSTWNLDTVEALKEDFIKNRKLAYERDAKSLMYRHLANAIQDKSSSSISESFLRRWLKESENVAEDKIDEMLPVFIKEMQWNKIVNHLEAKYNVEVSPAEINSAITARARQIMSQYGVQDQSFLGMIEARIRENQNEVYNIASNLKVERIFSAMTPDLTVETKDISLEAFNALLEETFGKEELQEEE